MQLGQVSETGCVSMTPGVIPDTAACLSVQRFLRVLLSETMFATSRCLKLILERCPKVVVFWSLEAWFWTPLFVRMYKVVPNYFLCDAIFYHMESYKILMSYIDEWYPSKLGYSNVWRAVPRDKSTWCWKLIFDNIYIYTHTYIYVYTYIILVTNQEICCRKASNGMACAPSSKHSWWRVMFQRRL